MSNRTLTIITGPQSAGKTTLARQLAGTGKTLVYYDRGFPAFPAKAIKDYNGEIDIVVFDELITTDFIRMVPWLGPEKVTVRFAYKKDAKACNTPSMICCIQTEGNTTAEQMKEFITPHLAVFPGKISFHHL